MSVIREQQVLLAESSSAVAEAMVQINVLDTEKTRLVSELELANTNAYTIVSEINQLKSVAAAESVKMASVIEAKASLELELRGKQSDLMAKSREVDDLKSEISAKEDLIAQLQLAGGAASGAQLAALKKELEDAKKDYNTLYEGYKDELKEKHDAWDSLEALRNPQSLQSAAGVQQGGSSSFECLLRIVQFAETACVESGDGLDWDHTELRRHVFHMVQSMIPNAKRKDLDRKVQEVRVCGWSLIMLVYCY